MIVHANSNLFTTVSRSAAGQITARSHLLATGWEAAAFVTAAAATFRVSAARWDIIRSPGSAANGGRDVAEFIGAEAYFFAGPVLRAVRQADGDLPSRLLAECVKGIIQAETYLYRERGFMDAEAYEASWKENYTGTCRLYSNPDRITCSWSNHIADRVWGGILFSRGKTAVVTDTGGGALTVAGNFIDSFHELAVRLAIAAGTVTAAAGNFLRAPDPVCPETAAALAALPGTPLAALGRQDVIRLVGGAQGCVHLADLINHMLTVVPGR